MATHNADNERIKRRYFVFLKEAKRQSEDSVDAAAKALARFEAATRYRDFKAFHFEQAVSFKRHLADQDSHATGGKLGKATLNATLAHLKRFFQWLADKPGASRGCSIQTPSTSICRKRTPGWRLLNASGRHRPWRRSSTPSR